MLRSLVGSEMCIRDRINTVNPPTPMTYHKSPPMASVVELRAGRGPSAPSVGVYRLGAHGFDVMPTIFRSLGRMVSTAYRPRTSENSRVFHRHRDRAHRPPLPVSRLQYPPARLGRSLSHLGWCLQLHTPELSHGQMAPESEAHLCITALTMLSTVHQGLPSPPW